MQGIHTPVIGAGTVWISTCMLELNIAINIVTLYALQHCTKKHYPPDRYHAGYLEKCPICHPGDNQSIGSSVPVVSRWL